MPAEPAEVTDISGARVLALLGDSVTTDHISPAGSIKADSPAGRYLADHGVDRKDFNSYGSRRGNHEVMIRGTFANIRLRNQLLDDVQGGFTINFVDGGAGHDLRRRAVVRRAGHPAGRAGRQGVRLGVIARLGGQGHRAAGRAGGHRRELRADPPVEPDRHGRAAAAVPGRRVGGQPGAGRHRDLRHHRDHGDRRRAGAADRHVTATREGGAPVEFDARVRIDTPGEADYYRNGGILQYVLRSLAGV